MKENTKRIFSIIAFILAVLLPLISHPNNGVKFLVFTLILIAFGGLITSLTISVWSKQNPKKSFIKNLPISFGFNSMIFLMGYLFTSLQPIILK